MYPSLSMMCIITIIARWRSLGRMKLKHAVLSSLFWSHGRRNFFPTLIISIIPKIDRRCPWTLTSCQSQIYIAFMMKHVACLPQKIWKRLCGAGPGRLAIYVHHVYYTLIHIDNCTIKFSFPIDLCSSDDNFVPHRRHIYIYNILSSMTIS